MMKKMAIGVAVGLLFLTVASCSSNDNPDSRHGGQQDADTQIAAENTATDAAADGTASETAQTASETVQTETVGKMAEMALPELTWQSQDLQLTHALDDGSVKHGSQKPEGKYVQVFMHCVGDNTLDWETVTLAQKCFLLRTADGTDYSASATGFKLHNADSVNFDELKNQAFREISPIFDIPIELHLDELSLVIKDSDGNETGNIPLDGIPAQAPDAWP